MANFDFISIATNKYVYYYFDLIESFLKCVKDSNHSINFTLLTDQPDRFSSPQWQMAFPDNFSFHRIRIPSLSWPDATLLRYELIEDLVTLKEDTIYVYLDADMKLQESPLETILNNVDSSRMTFVQHPGFYRPNKLPSLFSLYFRDFKMMLRDVITYTRKGGIGAWETNTRSSAWISRKDRKFYFCGGVWFGKSIAFGAFIKRARKLYELDVQHGYIAVWHDESYLNRFAVDFDHNKTEPSLCFVPEYRNLRNLSPLIEAVRK